MAAGQRQAQAGQALAPYRGILPTVRVEAGYLRTTDPLNAFGFLLRQRAVTPAAFAPSLLNDPEAIGNLNTGVVVEQPLFNADAWLGRSAARSALAAAEASEQWTRARSAVEVLRGYWGAVVAVEQVRTLLAAHQAASAHVRQAEALVEQGMATRSDALLASVKAGEIEAQLAAARQQQALARRQLALLMGNPSDTTFRLPDSLPSAERVVAIAARVEEDAGLGELRSDVRAAEYASAAAEADRRRARSLYLPRVNGFGRLDWNSPDAPLAGQSSWTLGVMLSWSPFAGGSELAELRSAAGRAETARAGAEAAQARAELERAQATDGLTVALLRLEIAGRSVEQAREAHRIVSRKYAGGLATVTDLFDAAAAETMSGLQQAAARHDALVAAAERRTAMGMDLGVLLDGE
jgi:outer membrane protein TolC